MSTKHGVAENRVGKFAFSVLVVCGAMFVVNLLASLILSPTLAAFVWRIATYFLIGAIVSGFVWMVARVLDRQRAKKDARHG